MASTDLAGPEQHLPGSEQHGCGGDEGEEDGAGARGTHAGRRAGMGHCLSSKQRYITIFVSDVPAVAWVLMGRSVRGATCSEKNGQEFVGSCKNTRVFLLLLPECCPRRTGGKNPRGNVYPSDLCPFGGAGIDNRGTAIRLINQL